MGPFIYCASSEIGELLYKTEVVEAIAIVDGVTQV